MKNILTLFILVYSFHQTRAQSTNCSPTLLEIYDFEVGDEFLYGIRENPGGGTQDYNYSTQRITILDKITSGDTIIYYRGGGSLIDTLMIVGSDSNHFLNQCDSTIVKVNSLSHYKNYPAGVQDIYSAIQVYKNDTVRTWNNDHPRIVKGIGGFSHVNAFYTKSDTGTYEPIDGNFDGPNFLVEYATGSGLLYESHYDFESVYEKRLIHKINGTDTTVYHTASFQKLTTQPIQFKAFPNPVTNILILDFNTSENKTYSISNSLGQEIKTGNVIGKSYSVDITDLSKGIYFVTSTSLNESGTIQFIKK